MPEKNNSNLSLARMKGFLAFVLCVVATSGHVLKFGEYEEQWLAWKSFHDKKYETQTQEDARHAIWRDNLRVSVVVAAEF